MAPKYRLIYFNVRGRVELSRWVLAVGGQEYEDVRVDKEQWMKMKADMPFKQLPVLEVDGRKFGQSIPIARYLARKLDLAGKDCLDKLQADMIVGAVEDITKAFTKARFEEDEEKKAKLQAKFNDEELPAILCNLEALLIQNNGGDGFFVGDAVTWADLAAVNIFEWLADDCLDKFPKILALKDRVRTIPKLAEWIANRPETEM